MNKSTLTLIAVFAILGLVVIIGLLTAVPAYNKMVQYDEGVSSAWSQVENVYQRRADLIPNLVNTVKGYAEFEKSTLTQVIEARAKATSVNISAENLNEQTMAQFQQAQDGLSSALSRLMVVVEKYPDLKANQNFLNLQSSWNEIEEQISAARRTFNAVVTDYNNSVEMFPSNFVAYLMGLKTRKVFEIPEQERQNISARDLFNK